MICVKGEVFESQRTALPQDPNIRKESRMIQTSKLRKRNNVYFKTCFLVEIFDRLRTTFTQDPNIRKESRMIQNFKDEKKDIIQYLWYFKGKSLKARAAFSQDPSIRKETTMIQNYEDKKCYIKKCIHVFLKVKSLTAKGQHFFKIEI